MEWYVNANAVLSKFSRNYMNLKKDLPIRPSEMGVLNILIEIPGPHTPVMVAERLDVSKPMVTAHINSLVGKGYVTKQPSLEDKRAYYILPTEKAVELVKHTKSDTKDQLECIRETMGQEKFNAFIALVEEADKIMGRKGGMHNGLE